VLLTVLKVPLMLVLSADTAATVPTTISPTSTAYSTAVGPSSLDKNRRTADGKMCISFLRRNSLKVLVTRPGLRSEPAVGAGARLPRPITMSPEYCSPY